MPSRQPRSGRARARSSRLVVAAIGFLVLLVVVGFAAYWITERRQDIQATDMRTYTPPTLSGGPSATSTSSTATGTTTPAVTATPAPTAAASLTAADQSFLELLSVSGYTIDDRTSRLYVDKAKSACQQLREGRPGQDVVNTFIADAEKEGSPAQEGEGLVYIGVASYCEDFSADLP